MSKEETLTAHKALNEVRELLHPERKYFFGKYTAVRVHRTMISVVFTYQPLNKLYREKSAVIRIPKPVTYEQLVHQLFTEIEAKL